MANVENKASGQTLPKELEQIVNRLDSQNDRLARIETRLRCLRDRLVGSMPEATETDSPMSEGVLGHLNYQVIRNGDTLDGLDEIVERLECLA